MSGQFGERQRQSRFEQGDDLVVMKFGGTSVEDAAAIRRLIGIVRSRLGCRPVVVVSALASVTDQLLEAGNAAANGHLGAGLALVRSIYVRHEQLADSLVEGSAYSALDGELRAEFRALESQLLALEASRHLDMKAQDRLLGFGECFSSRLIQEALLQAGVQRLQEAVCPLLERGQVPVLGGFIASTGDGVPTTLGRGGSDFSAAIVGAALCASRIEIWTDVDGIMTTDPKLCSEARVIPQISFDQAAELAHLGAKVLHPATLDPAMRENIPVYVLNSRRPEGDGTEILAHAKSVSAVSAITAKKRVVSVEIVSKRAVDSELLSAVYAAFDRYSCCVDVMATSLGRISVLVASADALPAIAADLLGVADVQWENHKSLVCVVGENIRRQPDVASRVFAAVADMNVRVICQGASDRTISFLVEESKVEESVQRLHDIFFPQAESARDWGGISSAFCQAG